MTASRVLATSGRSCAAAILDIPAPNRYFHGSLSSGGSMSAPDIVVDRLTKMYGTFLAVDHISFEVAKGTILGFLGPNGAGKTTTIRMLTCYMPPTSGSAKVAGFDVF